MIRSLPLFVDLTRIFLIVIRKYIDFAPPGIANLSKPEINSLNEKLVLATLILHDSGTPMSRCYCSPSNLRLCQPNDGVFTDISIGSDPGRPVSAYVCKRRVSRTFFAVLQSFSPSLRSYVFVIAGAVKLSEVTRWPRDQLGLAW